MIPEGFKQCSKCGEIKAFEGFYKRKSTKYGLRSHCKICVNIATKDYVSANPEKVKAQKKSWYDDNCEKVKAKNASWIKANPERNKEIKRAWIKANPENIKEYRKNAKQSNKYAITVLSQQFKIPKSELKPLLTPEIIEIKKNQLKYSRIIKNNDYGKKETLTNA